MNISVCWGAIFLIVQVNLKLVLPPLLIYIEKDTYDLNLLDMGTV